MAYDDAHDGDAAYWRACAEHATQDEASARGQLASAQVALDALQRANRRLTLAVAFCAAAAATTVLALAS